MVRATPRGRFITGLMDEGHSGNTGKLYRYDAGLNASVILDGLSLPSGLAWASEGDELFYVGSVARTLYRAPYPANGNYLQQVSVFARTPEQLGRPDGLALDVEDNLWVCQFNGGCLLQYDRHGMLLQTLPVPVPRPTSCCFGGPDMRTLFITTAKFGMSAAEHTDYPARAISTASGCQCPESRATVSRNCSPYASRPWQAGRCP